MQVNMHEAKSNLSDLGRLVHSGEKITIAKSGQPYLELIPFDAENIRKPGRLKGKISVPDDFNDEDPEVNEEFFKGSV